MTPEETIAAERELALVVKALRRWAHHPPPSMQGLAPSAAFAFAANVLSAHDHRRDGASVDVQTIERRVDLLEVMIDCGLCAVAMSYTADLAAELEEPEDAVRSDLLALHAAGLVVRVVGDDKREMWRVAEISSVVRSGLRVLVAQVDP